MISLITLKDIRVLPREEAEQLGLAITKITRFGLKDNIVTPFQYTKDCIKGEDAFYNEEEDIQDWFDSEGEAINYSYLYDPLPENSPDYVELEEYQLVDIAKFAAICDKPFTVVRSIDPTADKVSNGVVAKGTTIEWFENTGKEPEGNWVAEMKNGAFYQEKTGYVRSWSTTIEDSVIRYFLLPEQ